MKKRSIEEIRERRKTCGCGETITDIIDFMARLEASNRSAHDKIGNHRKRLDILEKANGLLAEIEKHIPDPPYFDGYEWTGEYRKVKFGDYFLSETGRDNILQSAGENFTANGGIRYIYRKFPPTPDPRQVDVDVAKLRILLREWMNNIGEPTVAADLYCRTRDALKGND
jgi:hypothetical protein